MDIAVVVGSIGYTTGSSLVLLDAGKMLTLLFLQKMTALDAPAGTGRVAAVHVEEGAQD